MAAGQKVSLTCGAAKLGHNRREPEWVSKYDKHIDPARTKDNITFLDLDIENTYHMLFDKAVQDFNTKQEQTRHNERKITDYYAKICKEEEQKHKSTDRWKNGNRKKDTKKRAVYEYIYQVGSKDNPVDPEKAKEILSQIAREWQDGIYIAKDGTGLHPTGIYLHMDETSPHLHVDFIPVGRYKRGMEYQNALDKGFTSAQNLFARSENEKIQSEGFRRTAQMDWEMSEREHIRDVALEYGVELDEIEYTGDKVHLDTPQYKQVMERAHRDADALLDGVLKKYPAALAEKIAPGINAACRQVQDWHKQTGRSFDNIIKEIEKEATAVGKNFIKDCEDGSIKNWKLMSVFEREEEEKKAMLRGI